jgi:hypothetical protein
VNLDGGVAIFADANAGTGIIVSLTGASLSGSAAGNYALTSVDTATADITPAPLTATADDQSRAFGEANPSLTISYAGFVVGDDVGDLDSLPTASTTATINSQPGTYPITLTGGADNNYTFNLVNGTLTITNLVLPEIVSISVENGVAVITWNAIDGREYKLSYKDNVTDVAWVDTATTIQATGPTASAENVVGNQPQRFYRVELLPLPAQ